MTNLTLRILAFVRSVRYNFSIISDHSGKKLTINLVIAVLQGILPFAIIFCIKLLIDYLTGSSQHNDSQRAYIYALLIVTALIFWLNGLLTVCRSYFYEQLSQSVSRRIYDRLHHKHAGLELSHYENPAEQDMIHRAVQQAGYRPVKILNELLTCARSVAASIVMVALFMTIRWYLVLVLMVIIIPNVWLRIKASRRLYALRKSQSAKEREMYYYNRVLTGFPYAKELKLFDFSRFFLRRFAKTQDELFEQRTGLRKYELRHEVVAQLFAVLLIFLMLGYVAYLKLSGAISIGTVAMFFFVFQRGYQVLNELFRSLSQIIEDNTYLNDFVEFLNLPQQEDDHTTKQTIPGLKQGISVENLSFRYENSQRDALKSVSLTIPAGKTVAFVGANGSGKTTLIKLLCGFYQPLSGKIFFDAIDSREIGGKNIREQVTAIFQDFSLYNIPVIENLALGNINAGIDLPKARTAARAAGIADVIDRLPDGYDTLLGNLFSGGEELSIGQRQKMGVARAFYRDSPILLMDEPSSALDAESELQILKSLRELSRDKTVVIISHQLSAVTWADRIYFFEEGEVVESGTHQELMELEGKYCSMYKMSNRRGNPCG